jgi:molybdopterin/thiamine biosynthesis adenylyltransferase
MKAKIVVPTDLWEQTAAHVLRDSSEHLAFMLCGYARGTTTYRLTARKLILVDDQDLEMGHRYGLALKLDRLVSVMNEANREALALVEVHGHPSSSGDVSFSAIDKQGQRELAAYLRDVAKGVPYGALVLGERAVEGAIWLPGVARPSSVEEVNAIGDTLSRYRCSGAAKRARDSTRRPEERFQRQVLAFGDAGQGAIRASRVAIVGLGGIGSIVGQQLAHLGVESFLLIDPDLVESSNLNRLVGSTVDDVDTPKVEVARRMLRRISPAAQVDALAVDVRTLDALQALVDVDVVFGCVDTDAARLILTEFAAAHLTPLIDAGVGIFAEAGRISEAGGRVTVYTPGRPCLKCSKDFNSRIAAEELESDVEREYRLARGYVTGANVPEPSVISLNGVIASLAVTELMALLTEFRPTVHYSYYDLLDQKVGRRIVKQDGSCVVCGIAGLGSLAGVERYAKTGLPTDLPDSGTGTRRRGQD